MSFMAILNKCADECSVERCPIKIYLAIHSYISIAPTLYRMLNSDEGIEGYKRLNTEFSKVIGKEPDTQRCYKYLAIQGDAEDLILRKKKLYATSNPDSIDLFGFKNNENHCFEVKTNGGKLSPWQVIRLNWMKEHGFPASVIRVNLKYSDKNQLLELYNSSTMGEIIEMLNPTLLIEDFELSDYQNSHDIVPNKAFSLVCELGDEEAEGLNVAGDP